MFGRSTKNPSQKQAVPSVIGKKGMTPSVIAADMNVLGNIISDGVLDIDGKIEGNVRCHTANIRPNGRVRGDVTAEIVHVHGHVEGIIKAKAVMLYSSAHVVGTLMHESLSVEDGAFIDGKFKRTDKVFIDDADMPVRPAVAVVDTTFDNDNEHHEPSDAERIVLENLRLIR